MRGVKIPEEYRAIKKLDWLQKACRNSQSRKSDDVRLSCPDCGVSQPSYNTGTGKPEWRRKDLLALSPEEQALAQAPFTTLVGQAILRGITDDDARAMGFCPPDARPESMIMDVLLVPPPIVRPSVSAQDGGKRRGQNDLTTRLREVVKVAAKLETLMAERDLTPAEHTKGAADLYLAVNSYLNPDKKRVKGVTPTKPAAAHGHGATGKSLSARFKVRRAVCCARPCASCGTCSAAVSCTCCSVRMFCAAPRPAQSGVSQAMLNSSRPVCATL